MNDTEQLDIRDTPAGAALAVKVVPGSSRDTVVGVLGSALKIATTAAAEKGKANRAVGQILARSLGVDPRAVHISAGPTSPRKEFTVAGLTAQALREKLSTL
jgi:uncharacterized protein YggU (UPF0235/DUF167 family)